MISIARRQALEVTMHLSNWLSSSVFAWRCRSSHGTIHWRESVFSARSHEPWNPPTLASSSVGETPRRPVLASPSLDYRHDPRYLSTTQKYGRKTVFSPSSHFFSLSVTFAFGTQFSFSPFQISYTNFAMTSTSTSGRTSPFGETPQTPLSRHASSSDLKELTDSSFDIEEVIRDASIPEKIKLLSGMRQFFIDSRDSQQMRGC